LEWTHRLLDAVETGLLKSELIPQDIKDYLTDHHDAVLRERALKILSETARLESKPLMQQMDALRHILGNGQGNPYAGEAIFAARCAGCHRLFFKGGAIGPDLTHYQRSDLSTLLPSILSPSAEIREGFQFIEITCRDGRRLGGFEVDRDLQVMMLRGLDGLDHTLPVDQIEQVQPMGRSLMPEGLLDGLNDQEMRDFFAYLRISQPILH
jgi:putative heme-binding domain-containing protein